MKKEHIRSLFVLLNLICSSAYAQRTACVEAIPGSRKKIAYSFHAQADIVPESQILDCSMIPIGATDVSGYGIWRDPDKLYKGMPSYHFKMKDDKERRVELQALYVTQSDIVEAGLTQQEIQDHRCPADEESVRPERPGQHHRRVKKSVQVQRQRFVTKTDEVSHQR